MGLLDSDLTEEKVMDISVTFLWPRYKVDPNVFIIMDCVAVVYATPTNYPCLASLTVPLEINILVLTEF